MAWLYIEAINDAVLDASSVLDRKGDALFWLAVGSAVEIAAMVVALAVSVNV